MKSLETPVLKYPSINSPSSSSSDIICSFKGCTAKVYRDDDHPDLKFLYCIQQCRDKILCDNRKMWCRDLEKRMKSLDTPVFKYPSNKPPSSSLTLSPSASAVAPCRKSYERGAEGPSMVV